MTRFRPTVEALDARTLPSAVMAGADSAPVLLEAQVVQLADEPTSGVVADQDASIVAKKSGGKAGAGQQEYLRVTLTDVLVSSYS